MHEYFQNFWMTGKCVSGIGVCVQNLCKKTVDMSGPTLQHHISLNFLNYTTMYISIESWEPYLSETMFIIKICCVVVEILYNYSEIQKHVNSFFAYCKLPNSIELPNIFDSFVRILVFLTKFFHSIVWYCFKYSNNIIHIF